MGHSSTDGNAVHDSQRVGVLLHYSTRSMDSWQVDSAPVPKVHFVGVRSRLESTPACIKKTTQSGLGARCRPADRTCKRRLLAQLQALVARHRHRCLRGGGVGCEEPARLGQDAAGAAAGGACTSLKLLMLAAMPPPTPHPPRQRLPPHAAQRHQ